MPPTETSPTLVAAIPARYGSTRLPAKPLKPIRGRPLIQHVYERAAAVPGLSRVVVLTDDERIGEVVDGFGGTWQMTPVDCASGTDRIAYAAADWPEVDFVLNIQGDWILEPRTVAVLADHLRQHPDESMATLAVEATSEEVDDPNAVKVVCDQGGYALYFSRSPLPYRRNEAGPATLKHWGIYGYSRRTLLRLASLPPSPLERAESLEQLRALENGIRIRVLPVVGEALGVDTPEDLDRAERRLGHGKAGSRTGSRI